MHVCTSFTYLCLRISIFLFRNFFIPYYILLRLFLFAHVRVDNYLISNTLLDESIHLNNQLFYTCVSHYWVYEKTKNTALQGFYENSARIKYAGQYFISSSLLSALSFIKIPYVHISGIYCAESWTFISILITISLSW